MPATDVSLIHVPYPEATARELRITADACHIHLRPGAGAEWVSGTYQDPSGQRSPTLTQDGGTLTIDHDRTTRELMAELVAGDPVFDLRLGTGQPYALTIQAAAIQSDAELGGLPLSRFAIRQKAGRNHLTFGQANPQSVELLQPSAEAATVEAGNLANANAAAISLKGDAVSYRLDFGGALQCSTRVAISTRASSVEITMPASTPARIASASLLSDLDVGDGFNRQEGAYRTPAAAATDRPLLTIDAAVEVRTAEAAVEPGQELRPTKPMNGHLHLSRVGGRLHPNLAAGSEHSPRRCPGRRPLASRPVEDMQLPAG